MLYGYSQVIIQGTLVTLELAISSSYFSAGDRAYRGWWETVEEPDYFWFFWLLYHAYPRRT